MNIITKVCTKCGEEKELSFFELRGSGKYRTSCRECQNKYYKSYYLKNQEKKKEAAKKNYKVYYQNNKDKKREYQKANWEKIKARMRKWWRECYSNSPKESAKRNKRRALIKGLDASFTAEEWKNLCEKYDNTCLKCGKKDRMTPDHVIPLSRGGVGTIDNIQPLCRSCNCSKGAKTIDYR